MDNLYRQAFRSLISAPESVTIASMRVVSIRFANYDLKNGSAPDGAALGMAADIACPAAWTGSGMSAVWAQEQGLNRVGGSIDLFSVTDGSIATA